jgi:dephospho-CoA kinase
MSATEVADTKLNPMRAGITGGIGSGKTTVCRIFAALGVPVYDADTEAKKLMNTDVDLISGITALFGPESYTAEGVYNRPFVGGIVFADPEKLAALNALVHPAVEAHSRRWHVAQMAAGHHYTLKEAALLVESGSYKHLDVLMVVTAPEALRIRRVVARDGTNEAAVRARMRNQLPEEAKLALADYVIHNDGEQMLVPQVWHIHQSILFS